MFIIQMWNKLKRLENRGYKQMSIKLRSSSSEVGKLLWWKDHDFHNSDIIKIKTLGKRELQRSIKLRSSISKVHKLLWWKDQVVYNSDIIFPTIPKISDKLWEGKNVLPKQSAKIPKIPTDFVGKGTLTHDLNIIVKLIDCLLFIYTYNLSCSNDILIYSKRFRKIPTNSRKVKASYRSKMQIFRKLRQILGVV